MAKIFFASILAIFGTAIAFACGSVSAISSWTAYTAGAVVSMPTGSIDVCVNKTGGYAGDDIVADIDNGTFETQLVFEAFNGSSSCKTVNDIDAGATIRYVIPMGYSGLKYGYDSSSIALNLDDATLQNKYLNINGATLSRIAASKVQVSFDANGGTGIMSVLPAANLNTNITLPTNTLTKPDYKFDSWNTKVDGTGTRYEDSDTVSFATGGEVTLYAQWVPAVATLDTGEAVNIKMKKMAGTNTQYTTTSNETIKAIKKASSLPSDFDRNDQSKQISSSSSLIKIYAWFDDTDNNNDGEGDGIIYYYSDADKIMGNQDMSRMFIYLTKLDDISGLIDWDVSRVNKMTETFQETYMLSSIEAIRDWDVSNVDDMSCMFCARMRGSDYTDYLSDISPLGAWNVSNVKSFDNMFEKRSISSIEPLRTTQRDGYKSWDMSNAQSIGSMFSSNKLLSDIDAFSSWNLASMTNIGGLLARCASVDNISALANWDTSKIEVMAGTFMSTSVTNISALSNWNTTKVKDLNGMFANDKITDISPLATTQRDGYVSWDVSNVEDMTALFKANSVLEDITPLSSWNVSNVKYFGVDGHGGAGTVGGIFEYANKLVDISPIAAWDTSSARSFYHAFHGTKITNVDALATTQRDGYKSWNMSQAENMEGMFGDSYYLNNISGISNWNTSNVVNMEGMFANVCISNLDDLATTQRDGYVSWDVSNVTNMRSMFYHWSRSPTASSLNDIFGISNWNTAKVTNMYSMFLGVTSLTDISPLGNWNVSNVTDMRSMFADDVAISDFRPLDGWVLNVSLDRTNMFSGVSPTAILPSWY